jgi:succinate dehydrogenase flavin-adding protein (antitoxin of CptAB toxin-antitoxin module)
MRVTASSPSRTAFGEEERAKVDTVRGIREMDTSLSNAQ